MKMCKGGFFTFLKSTLRLEKLPYDIKLIDLITENCISVDLFVELPKSYFESWTDFPVLGNIHQEELADELKDVGYYNPIIRVSNETTLSALSHPYDEELHERFTRRFSVSHPSSITKYDHPNGRVFCPNEAYLSYWKAYILLEAIDECLFIDRYLPKAEGSKKFKEKVTVLNELWMRKYQSIFNAVSHYRTFISQFHHLETPLEHAYGEISQHLLKRAKISELELHTGLETLLILHRNWTEKLKRNGMSEYQFALKSLKRDIYFLFEWLCGLGFSEKSLFDKWLIKDRQARRWSQLKDVLDFEEISFKSTFELYTPIYCKDHSSWFNLNKVTETFDELNKHLSFDPWIRSFTDLHTSINKADDISLIQPRLLDNLLVLTIRTEVLIRTMLLGLSGKEEPSDFKEVLRGLGEFCIDESCKTLFITVANNGELTKLQDRPESLFTKIEQCDVGKKWSKKQIYFFRVILKFVTSRNYFAHHYYKDQELNYHSNKIGRDILVSCLQTILFINNSISKKN
jgi:hypothetical protein